MLICKEYYIAQRISIEYAKIKKHALFLVEKQGYALMEDVCVWVERAFHQVVQTEDNCKNKGHKRGC